MVEQENASRHTAAGGGGQSSAASSASRAARALAWLSPEGSDLRWERRFLVLAGVVAAYGGWLLLRSNLSNWDAAGHVVAVDYAARHIWPMPFGWNHLHQFGFPQNYYYPPLVHWLAATLAQVVSVETAFKALIVSAVLLLPLALMSVARALGLRGRDAFSACGFGLGVIFLSRYQIGGDMYGTLAVGLLPAAFAFTLALFAFRWLRRAAEEPRAVAPAGVLAALVGLSHVFVAIGFVLWSFTVLVTEYVPRGRESLRRFAGVVCIALLVGSLWLIPFFAHPGNVVGRSMHGLYLLFQLEQMGWPGLILAGAFLLACALAVLLPASGTNAFLLLALSAVGGAVLLNEMILDHPLDGVHVHRLGVFFLVPALAWTGATLSRTIRWPVAPAVVLALLVVAVSTLRQDNVRAFHRELEVPMAALPRDGRGFTNAGMDGVLWKGYSPHLLFTTLLRGGQPMAQGLFVESSAPSPFTLSLGLELWPDFVWWGVTLLPPQPEHVGDHVRMLGIQWLLSRTALDEATVEQLPLELHGMLDTRYREEGRTQTLPFHYYQLDVPLAELVENNVWTTAPAAWDETVKTWWDDGHPQWIPVLSPTPLAFSPSLPGETVHMTTPGPDGFELRVDSAAPRWVYVKVPYFQDWRATTDDGQRLVVYRAGANMMAVKAQGRVSFRIVRGWLEFVAIALSALGLVLAGWHQRRFFKDAS